ncbi:MAG: Elongation factor P [Phycisphaerae bacterium]|nr:Elongation factor P [Phycisphaerae bacterium]
MIKAVEMRKGRACIYEGDLYTCHEIHHVAKGNKRSYMSARLKNFKTGQIIDVRYRVDDMIEIPFLETREYEYLFQEGQKYVLMDKENYDQLPLEGEVFGEALQFLKENMPITGLIYDGKVIQVELPNVVDLVVKDTPPVLKGSTASPQPKDAILETGARVRVPAFIEPGEVIRVDTRSGEYVERAKA